MNAALPTRTADHATPAPWAAAGWGVVVVGILASAAADAAWGWEGAATRFYGLTTLALMALAALVVATQVRLNSLHGGLGPMAIVGIVITVLGALLGMVAWALVLWTTALGIGTLLFGLPLLRRNTIPRNAALALTFAMPAAAVLAWVSAVVLDAAGDGTSSVDELVIDLLVSAAIVVFAVGLAGVGRWMRTADALPEV